MPIAFPQPKRGPSFDWPENAFGPRTLNYIPAPNMDAPGKVFVGFQCDLGNQNKNINFRELARTYRDVTATTIINDVRTSFSDRPFTDRFVFDRVMASLNMVLSGVSRNSTGGVLPNCQVLIFRTEDKSLVGETTSDGSGNWSILMMKGGPFFYVEYLAGSPDRAGTSKNDRVPVQQ